MRFFLLFLVIFLTSNLNALPKQSKCEGGIIYWAIEGLKDISENQKETLCSIVTYKSCFNKKDLIQHYQAEGYTYAKGVCGREKNSIKALDNFIKAITEVEDVDFSWDRDTAIDTLFWNVKDELYSYGKCRILDDRVLNTMYDMYEEALLDIYDTKKLPDTQMHHKFWELMYNYEGYWNFGRAFKWIEKAATRGWPEGINQAGEGYSQGRYPYLNDHAINLYKKTCGRKHGYYVLKDAVEAYKWFNIGAHIGDETSKVDRDMMERFNEISEQGIIEANKLAKEWIRNELKN